MINKIRERLSKITPPPWGSDGIANYVWEKEHVSEGSIIAEMRGWGYLTKILELSDYEACEVQRGNADFIAHAPEDIAFLLGEVERLTAERDEYKEDALSLVKLTHKKPCFLCAYEYKPVDKCAECRGNNNWKYRGDEVCHEQE